MQGVLEGGSTEPPLRRDYVTLAYVVCVYPPPSLGSLDLKRTTLIVARILITTGRDTDGDVNVCVACSRAWYLIFQPRPGPFFGRR
jgi:hypothetical protein